MTIFNRIIDKLTLIPSKVHPPLDDIDFPDSLFIFLIGFQYDDPTEETFTWITSILLNSSEQKRIFRFHEKSLTKRDLLIELDKNLQRIEIFCGHGDIDGLYGPPFYEVSPDILKDIHTIFYDKEMIKPGPSSMFAFCCSAANDFGREFSAEPGNSFLGFNGEIYFPKEIRPDLKYIFQVITKDIIEKGKIEEEHQNMFINEIDELIKNVKRRYRDADLMGSYLLEYKSLFVARV